MSANSPEQRAAQKRARRSQKPRVRVTAAQLGAGGRPQTSGVPQPVPGGQELHQQLQHLAYATTDRAWLEPARAAFAADATVGENDPRTVINTNGGDVDVHLPLTLEHFDAALTIAITAEKGLREQIARRAGYMLQAVDAHTAAHLLRDLSLSLAQIDAIAPMRCA